MILSSTRKNTTIKNLHKRTLNQIQNSDPLIFDAPSLQGEEFLCVYGSKFHYKDQYLARELLNLKFKMAR